VRSYIVCVVKLNGANRSLVSRAHFLSRRAPDTSTNHSALRNTPPFVRPHPGIALAFALSAYGGNELARATSVCLFYGLMQLILIVTYLTIAWKCSWTYAPPSEPFWRVMCLAYQPTRDAKSEANSFEISGNPSDTLAVTGKDRGNSKSAANISDI